MRHNIFKGVGVALVTPFLPDGTVDVTALRSLTQKQLDGGVDFLCVLGTTAETPCLSANDKQIVMNTVREVAAGKVPLLLGCGGNNTAVVIDYLKHGDLKDFDGVLIVCPYYNKPSQEGLYRHYKAIAEASPLPIVLYNVPGRTGVNLLPETTLRIAQEFENVVAIKEASGNIEQIASIVAAAPEGFDVVSGDDGITYELIKRGVAGVISVVCQAYPEHFSTMVHAVLEGKDEEARQLDEALKPFYRLSMKDGNPAGIKCFLSLQCEINNILRLPLVPVTKATEEEMRAAMSELPQIFRKPF